MPPVCHTLISLPFLLPLCSAAPLSLSLSLPCPTAVTLFCFLALLLSRSWFCSHLPPWCASPPEKTSDLSSQFLVLPLGFCCPPMWPPPPPPPSTHCPNKEQQDCPAQWGQNTQKHTHFQENMTCICAHECVGAYMWLFLCLRAGPLPRNVALFHTHKKPAKSAFVQRGEEVQSCSTEESLRTHTHTLIFPHFLCSVIWSYMHSQEWAGLT